MRTHAQLLKIVFAAMLIVLAALTTVSADAQGKQKAASSSPGTLSFLPVVTYDPGGQSFSVAIADLNGDGKQDLVVANAGLAEGVIGVLLGRGDGSFEPVVIYNSGGDIAYSVAVADVNGDGKPDLLVAD